MSRSILAALLLFFIPAVAFVGGGWLLEQLSGRKAVPKPGLGTRFHYTASEAEEQWRRCEVPVAERTFLKLDMAFPVLYCGTLALSLFLAWARLGRPYAVAWVLAPVLLTLLADWSENVILLGQVERFLAASPLEAGWIQAASTLTAIKLYALGASWLALFLLVTEVIGRTMKSG